MKTHRDLKQIETYRQYELYIEFHENPQGFETKDLDI